MALQDLLALQGSKKKIGISEERVNSILPIVGQYAAFWREYPDLFVDFLVRGRGGEERKDSSNFIFIKEFS